MTEIPKGAIEKADEILDRYAMYSSFFTMRDRVARFIADVSEKASYADQYLAGALFPEVHPAREKLRSLFLPNPEDPLLKEAREIVKASLSPDRHSKCNCRTEIDAGEWDDKLSIRCTLAALRKGN